MSPSQAELEFLRTSVEAEPLDEDLLRKLQVQKFDPAQPRAPAGTSEGGQWVRQGWGDSRLFVTDLHGVGNPALMDLTLGKLQDEVRAFAQRLPMSDEANVISRTRFSSMLPPPPELMGNLPDGTLRPNPIYSTMGTAQSDPLQGDSPSRRYLVVYNDYLLRDKRVLAGMPDVREHVLIHEIGHVVDFDNGVGLEAAKLDPKDTWLHEALEGQKLLMKEPGDEASNALRLLSDVTDIWSAAHNPSNGFVEVTADLYAYLRGANSIRGIPRSAFRRIFPKTIEIYTRAFQSRVRDFEPLEPVMPPPLYKAEVNLSAIPGWWQGWTMGVHDELVRLRPVVRKQYNPAQPRWPAGSGDKSGEWKDESVPPAPGTAPVPEGALRVYHYTDDLSAVLATGLQRSKAKGHSYGEPDVVWASAQRPGNHKEYVEFYVYPNELGIGGEHRQEKFTPEQVQQREAYGSDVTLLGDLPPERIISYHQRWHDTYRYLSESPQKIMEVLQGDHDGITKDDFPDEYHAIQLLKRQYALKNGEVVRKYDPSQPRHPKGVREGGRWSKTRGGSLWASEAVDPQREKFEGLAKSAFKLDLTKDFAPDVLEAADRPRFEYLKAFVELASHPASGFGDLVNPLREALDAALAKREARRLEWVKAWGDKGTSFSNEQEAIAYFENVLETTLRFPPPNSKGGNRSQLWAVPKVAETLKELKDKGWGMPRGVDMGMWWHEGLQPGISYAKELVAMYTGFDMLHVNAPMFRDLAHLEAACNDDSFLVSSGPKLGLRGAILHEMIHRRDSQDRMKEGGLWGSDLEALRGIEWSKRKMTYADYPSVYSMSGANDFVAEVGVAMYLESTLSQNAIDLYKKLDGPKI